MKKIIALVSAVVMIFCLSIPVFAGNYVNSPSLLDPFSDEAIVSSNPQLREKIILSSFGERDEKLTLGASEDFYNSFKKISESKSVYDVYDGNFNKALHDYVIKDKSFFYKLFNKRKYVGIAVSDLFYIENTDPQYDAGTITVKVKCENVKNFRGVVNNEGGTWTIVNDATVDANGNISFKTDKLGTFAVVVEPNAKEPFNFFNWLKNLFSGFFK